MRRSLIQVNIIIFTPLIIFYFLIIARLIVSLRSNSSLMIWISLEVNILRFLPIISSNDLAPFENTIKYFLVQSLASILFITTAILRIYKYKYRIEIVLTLAIVLKLGIAPFHSWFIIIKKLLIYIICFCYLHYRNSSL